MQSLDDNQLKTLFQALEKSVKCGIWNYDSSTGKVWCSQGILDILDCDTSFQEMSVEEFFNFIHPEDKAYVFRARQKAQEEQKPQTPLEYRLLTHSNEVKWVCAEALENQSITGVVWGTFHDITNIKEGLLKLEVSEERLKQTLKDNHTGLWEHDLRTNQLFWSEEMYTILGVKQEDFVLTLDNFFNLIYSEDREQMKLYFQEHLSNPPSSVKLEYRVELPSGDLRWIETKANFSLDQAGQPLKLRGIITDISDKKLYDDYFKQVQRLESIGDIASGVAHDLNNVLAPIYMYSSLLKVEPMSATAEENILEIEQCTERAMKLVEQVTSFAKGGKPSTHSEFLATDIINDLTSFIQSTFPKLINITTDLWDESIQPILIGEQNNFYHALLNICINARDAFADGAGVINMKCMLRDNEQLKDVLGFNPLLNSEQYVVIQVQDNGKGIPEDLKARVLEPFFTTKEKGTGLGLSNSHKTILQMHGSLHVQSQLDKGSVFTICLPCQLKDNRASNDDKDVSPNFSNLAHRTILIIDDEVNVLRSMSKILQLNHVNVISETQGTDAIASFASSELAIDVVISDLQLPDMSGMTLIKTFRKMNPDVKIVVCSGLITSFQESQLREYESLWIVEKPFRPEEFLSLLSEIVSK